MKHKGWHSRGYLPHFDSQNTIQFVTFRLADSLPSEALAQVVQSDRAEALTDEILDRGLGACWLSRTDIARLVEDAFIHFDGERYQLLAWTIMPNHVHVLLAPSPGAQLGTIVGSWKSYTARRANELLGRRGIFWQADYWDRFIRNEEHFAAIVAYIDDNPVKAGLIDEAHQWPWGSARFSSP